MRTAMIILAGCLVATGCLSQTIELSRNSVSDWKIFADPSAAVNLDAAHVLQSYFEKVTGARIDVVHEKQVTHNFIIGGKVLADVKEPGNDGYVIVSRDNNIYIGGSKGKAVLYGTYTFIEKYLGCRKWDGTKAYTPPLKTLSVPAIINARQDPPIVYREAYFPASFDNEYLDWHGLHRFEDKWGLWGHSFFKLLPPDKYFKLHPEYFSMIGGKRQPVQLCLSNAAVAQIVVDELRRRIADNPAAQYWSVSQNDDIGPCECDRCRKLDVYDGGAQGSLLNFVNKIAAQFPGKIITTLAYSYSAAAPLHTHAAPNVAVMLSTIDAYRSNPLSTEPSAAKFRNDLSHWQSKCNRLFLWDYNTQFTNYLAPFPIEKNFAADIKYFVANNITGIFSQGSGDTHADMAELKSYLLAKLLWDPSMDAGAIINEFVNGYYGKAAPEVLSLLNEMRSNVHSDLDIYGNPVNDHDDYLSPVNMDRYSAIMDRAEAKVEADPDRLNRVRRIRLSQEYTYLQQARFYGKDPHGVYKRNDDGSYKLRTGLEKRLKTFVRSCETNGVKQLSEAGGKLPDYLAGWRPVLSGPVPVNLAANAKLTLTYPFAPEYPSKKERTLVDETPGYDDFSYNWLCFYGKPMEATIDLGTQKLIQTVKMHFLEDARHWIFHPAAVSLETSEDGIVFYPLHTIRTVAPEEDYTIQMPGYEFMVKKTARFLRVRAENQPGLPVWRYHRTKKPMIACDEIWVN